MSQVLQLAAVGRTYGEGATSVAALRNVNLTISKGEFVAVMGPSGSGKSSLLALAGGLDRPTSGEIYVEGTPLSGLTLNELARLRRRAVGYVFQDFNLVPTLTALENVSLPRELDGVPTRKARRQAKDALRLVGIENLADRFMDEMSGGQQQRVAIARAIVGDRHLILADEPTGALDSSTGDEIMGVLRHRADEGSAVMLVTHEARHAAWADRVIFIRDGRIVDESQAANDPAALLAQSGL
ncbi:ABC transporter ATP-binding protein [Arthrobacter tumbae]|uniref:ABC transporter ATP-binding protein n=1 Tax=Arthrobacter tumbae TaxID=163874 RepID=UPI001956B5BB|nr:ABC transporter ATP-binding protein [Arthrobacter tumbae]MBM7782005.1 putative ABC transport system ATP-binding protein [Arthrobacter tumbae]